MNEQGIRYSLRVRIGREKNFFGPGVSQLLRLVEETGSLQTAAAAMEMSYSKAWKIVRTAEAELGFPLMERHVGGTGGGFSKLTEKGRAFIERYERFQREVYETADRLFLRFFAEEPQKSQESGADNEKN